MRSSRQAALLFAASAFAAHARQPPFLKALDLSYLAVLDCGGACSPFRPSAGAPPGDALAQAAAAGINAIRLRLWVNPSTHTASPWPAGNADYSYANLTNVGALAARARAANLSFWLDMHYSDTWADPGHQRQPAAWQGSTFDDLVLRVAEYTRASVAALVARGTPPAVVQVGNEITNGLLWAAGDCAQGGQLFVASGCGTSAQQWQRLARLVAAGVAAVRAAAPAAWVVLHTDLGNRLASKGGAAYIAQWYETLANAGVDDYDCVGLSFYPNWGSGGPANVALLAPVAAALGKPIVLAETAYPWRGGGAPGPFPFSPEGQRDYLRALLAAVAAQPWGVGVAYWGGEFYNQADGSGWSGLWDPNGVALPALAEAWRQG